MNDTAATLMLAVAGYAAARLVAAPLRHRTCLYDVDLAHIPMGIAMAGMFLPHLATLPNTIWAIVFGATTGWFLAQTARAYTVGHRREHAAGHYLPHAVHAGTMVYMVLAMPAMSTTPASMSMPAMVNMAGGGMARLPTLALVLTLFMAGYIVMLTDRLAPRTATPAPAPSRAMLAPRAADLYKIVMSLGMGYGLVTML